MKRVILVAAVVIGVLLAAGVLYYMRIQAPTPAPALVFAKDTTFITEPLRPDGTPDYVAYLNRESSQGVTADNNAAVLLVKALGPEFLNNTVREELLRHLGLTKEIADIQTLELLRDHLTVKAAERGEGELTLDAWEQIEKEALEGPWAPEAFPDIDAWITANEGALDTLLAASKQTHYYLPLLNRAPDSPMISPALPRYVALRSAMRTLGMRANRSIASGQPARAVEDLLAWQRLACLLGQCPMMDESYVAMCLQREGAEQISRLAVGGHLPAEQSRALLAKLNKLPSLLPIADIVGRGKRMSTLSACFQCAQAGLEPSLGVSELAGQDSEVDWNVLLRMVNSQFDRMEAAMRSPDARTRREQQKRAQEGLETLVTSSPAAGGLRGKLRAFLMGSAGRREEVSRCVALLILSIYMPGLDRASDLHDLSQALLDQARLALALEVWREEHGEYPETLSVLAPQLVPEVPSDALSGEPFRYTRTQDGYVLYGLGMDLDDDGGTPERMTDEGDDGDMVLRVENRPSRTMP